jgi:Holliday junction resolvase RusA-like endonuclease
MHQSRVLRTLDWQIATRFASALCMALGLPRKNMLTSHRCEIRGVPYAQDKVRGNVSAPTIWSAAVVEQTKHLPKLKGKCLLRVTFRLPPDKFPTDHPFGNDLDNLLKRFFDALDQTVFSEAPGQDGCVVALEASKAKVGSVEESGADLEIIEL